ncbi:protein TONSOKU [Impatiens glandulifera]|uniref:protein TONSOKU n=1 Tax=Impatiens glandulifera TaxID=253017 RepID=UPI001FB191D9|nr:protein TONSOKU [Impatiens glandulifera]
MTRGGDDAQLSAAKRAYRNAAAEGNRSEEARWANMIGNLLKNRGEYVEALKWLRIDYEISVKHLSETQLLPTCQSLGEVYLRLEHFNDALIYQKKHLQLAKEANDLVEQQRACTQLGRTYHEMFLRSENDHCSIRNAKKYFKLAIGHARSLKEKPSSNMASFLEEYIDAYNNIGMIEMDLDNLEEAVKILTRGLQICDEEEVPKDKDGRSRLHHNLGKAYMELRKWEKSREHIEKDILICKRIGHVQGEAKGYINLGELYYRVQKCEEAICCYEKALKLSKQLEDEDALANQICQNIETVKEAMKVAEDLLSEEQNLKKLSRQLTVARGTSSERKCLLQQNASIDRLIEKSSMIFAWVKHLESAKKKKLVANELCDKEKLSDSFLFIGESYQKLRNFSKAIKWYKKSWEVYKSIGSLEGQALAKINIGTVLDSDGNLSGALDAFEEGYRIAVKANLPSVQLSALENMHYCHMIRFDNVDEARKLQQEIDKLKQSNIRNLEAHDAMGETCSETETETEEQDQLLHQFDFSSSSAVNESNSPESRLHPRVDALNDDETLISLLHTSKKSSQSKMKKFRSAKSTIELSPRSTSKSTHSDQNIGGRKRFRVIFSDDDESNDERECFKEKNHETPAEDIATSDEYNSRSNLTPVSDLQNPKGASTKHAPPIMEESICSFNSSKPQVVLLNVGTNEVGNSYNSVANGSKCARNISGYTNDQNTNTALDMHTCIDENCQCLLFKVGEDFVHMPLDSCIAGDKLSIDHVKVEVACLYFLKLPVEKRSKGLLPIIQHLTYGGKVLNSLEAIESVKDHLSGKAWIEVSIEGWVQKRLMQLYVDSCMESSEPPNIRLLSKLYNLEVSEDEIIVSDCELQDVSISPLLNALQAHRPIAVLNLSHNLLGNVTMEKLQQVFSSSQGYGGLVLDFHCNRLGPTALFQICECPVLFSRLEVLNISGNRLTDACGSYLSTILEKCKALYSLNIDRCSLTSRAIQKIADSLGPESVLAQLSLGYNGPISANSLANLLAKLTTLSRISELNLNGLKLSKLVVDKICQLTKLSRLSALMLGGTGIGTDGAIHLLESLSTGTQEPLKPDQSYCAPSSHSLGNDISLAGSCLLELNLGGNAIMQEGGVALASFLNNPECSLRVLVLNKCRLGLNGMLAILKALVANDSLEELNLAENIDVNEHQTLERVDNTTPQGLCGVNMECSQLEVADSEEDEKFSESCIEKADAAAIDGPIMELAAAIGMAKQLQMLDLSSNGFTKETAEELYVAWSVGSKAGVAEKHIEEPDLLHLLVNGHPCCKVRLCCQRN